MLVVGFEILAQLDETFGDSLFSGRLVLEWVDAARVHEVNEAADTPHIAL